MVLTDTHTHLYSEAFEADRHEVIKNALNKQITRFFLPAIDATCTQNMLDLQKAYPENIFLMAGLHPTHVKENYLDELAHVEEMLKTHTFYAVGETGIDLYWDKTFFNEQRQAFNKQIELAKQYNLPVVIHCREAFDEIFEVLEQHKDDKLFGVFHCFTGTFQQALRAISFNMKLGIGGVVTFKNGGIDKFLKDIPLGNIVLETDAPYLAPVPFRGKRNESSYLTLVAEKVASLYNLSVEEVAAVTTQNAKDVFGV